MRCMLGDFLCVYGGIGDAVGMMDEGMRLPVMEDAVHEIGSGAFFFSVPCDVVENGVGMSLPRIGSGVKKS